MILDQIIESKKKEIAAQELSLEEAKKCKRASGHFYRCLKGKNNIIAEVKFKSPKMELITNKTVEEVVSAYDHYANAISVLTDEPFFGGNLARIAQVRAHTHLPLLRKDFIISPYQVYESRYYGADAILLIVGILEKDQLKELLDLSTSLGMDTLVEVHNEEELTIALSCGAKIIGINNRNLQSKELAIDLNTTIQLKENIPSDVLVVSESGYFNQEDILNARVNAVLIGTSLMKADDTLSQLQSYHQTKVKICGITTKEDAQLAVSLGADLLGFNFYEKSPRHVSWELVAEIISSLPLSVQTVGVFVNMPKEEINRICETCNLDFIQLHGDEKEGTGYNRLVINVRKVSADTIGPGFASYATLYDTASESYGGSGKSYPRKLIDAKGKTIIAGGINPENASEALALNPFAIDVASGVEQRPGVKDPEKISKLIEQVNT